MGKKRLAFSGFFGHWLLRVGGDGGECGNDIKVAHRAQT